MKTELKAKYLHHLLSKKKKDEGFTLIELLVVVIIIGILAAVALPTMLGQVGKARESGAKSNLGVINRAQQAFAAENNGVYAADFDALGTKAEDSADYKYKTANTGKSEATAQNAKFSSYCGNAATSAVDKGACPL